jgi:hypothetical protein
VIEGTAEHPFYVYGKGWTPLAELQPGDWLRTDNGWVQVGGVKDTGRVETVYNLRVADHHTYFVGTPEWGFGIWAHNADCALLTTDGVNYIVQHQGKELFKGDATGLRAFWQAHPEHNLVTPEGRLWLPVVPEAQLQAEVALGVQRGVKPTVVTGPQSLAPFADEGEALIWVRMRNGEIRVHPETIRVDGVPQRVLHTQLSGGEPVLAAGQINGVRQSRGAISVTEMTPNSGHHFSPEFTKGVGRTHEPQVIHQGLEKAWAEMERLGIPVRIQHGPPGG